MAIEEKPKAATYIDENGDKQTGLYTQAENAGLSVSQPAAVSPSAEGTGTHWDNMRDHYQQMYEAQVRGNNETYDAAEARARQVLKDNIETLNQGYQGTNKQLYRDYMQHKRTLPQEMAARGYSGGLSESSMLRLRNSYEEGLGENERARLGQISSAERDLAQKLFEARTAADTANRQADLQRMGYLTQLQEQQYQDQQQRAATMASAGDFSGYRALGYSDADVKYLEEAWAMANPATAYAKGKISADMYYRLTGSYPPGYSTGSSGGGGGGGGSRKNDTSTGEKDWSKLGYSDMDVINAMANDYPVYSSPLTAANAMKRAANRLASQ